MNKANAFYRTLNLIIMLPNPPFHPFLSHINPFHILTLLPGPFPLILTEKCKVNLGVKNTTTFHIGLISMLEATFLTHQIQIRSPDHRWELTRRRRLLDHRMEESTERNETLQTFQLSNKRTTTYPEIIRLSTTNKKN